jgi:hypothetical protein
MKEGCEERKEGVKEGRARRKGVKEGRREGRV